jgi:hypothetical protein
MPSGTARPYTCRCRAASFPEAVSVAMCAASRPCTTSWKIGPEQRVDAHLSRRSDQDQHRHVGRSSRWSMRHTSTTTPPDVSYSSSAADRLDGAAPPRCYGVGVAVAGAGEASVASFSFSAAELVSSRPARSPAWSRPSPSHPTPSASARLFGGFLRLVDEFIDLRLRLLDS